MSFENVYRYTTESINLCNDVLNFYQKKKDIEFQFSQSLSNLCQTYKSQYYNIINQQQNTPELQIKSHLLQNTLWKTFINQIEEFDQIARYHRTLAVSYEDSIINPLYNDIEDMETSQKKIVDNGLEKVKTLQNAYTELKRKKEMYKEAQDAAKEAAEAHNKGLNTYNIKDKEMEKLTAKYQLCLEKVNYAKDGVSICEKICKKHQEQYYLSDLPVILENLKSKEEERNYNLKKLFTEANKIEKLSIQYIINITNSVAEGLKDIDVPGDIDNFTQQYMYSFNHDSDISVRSLINPEKAGRMNVHKDSGSMEWKTRYFVLMSKHFRLYCFESEDSVKPKEIIDLNDVSIHLLDDSYFNMPNSFQIVVYNNIMDKTRRKAFAYYLVAETATDREEWFTRIRDIAYCCQRCNITKMILYEYNKNIKGYNNNNQAQALKKKSSGVSDVSYSRGNSHNLDCNCTNKNLSTSIISNGSNIPLSLNNNNENNENNTILTEQFKKTFEPELSEEKKDKSLITFAEALDCQLVFLNDEDNIESVSEAAKRSSPASNNCSQYSLNKTSIKSPRNSQIILQNSHEEQQNNNMKSSSFAQRFYENTVKDKKLNRYSTSFLESPKSSINNNLKREISIDINGNNGSNLKKDSSFFKMIKSNTKNTNINNIVSSVSEGSIDNLSCSLSKQNCRFSIISNVSPSKMSQYSMSTHVNTNTSEDNLNNMFNYLNDKNKYRINRNIKLCILEARNLYPNEKKKNIESYAYIFFDDIVQAKTSKQLGSNPFWGEEFNFEHVLPCLDNIHIIICQQHRVSNDSEIGHIIIPINKLHSNKKIEEWIPIMQLNSNNENFNASIRIGITLIDEHILPIEDYNEFIDYVFQPSLEPVIRLGNVVQQRDEFSKTILYILMDRQKEVDGIKTLVSLEIKNTDDPNIIFRGNSLTTKIIDQYMKLIGNRYLNNTLKRQVQNVYATKESCEVDPSKIDKSEDIKKHWKKLLGYVNNFWDAIRQSVNKCPSKLKEIFNFTKMEVAKTFENENTVQYSSISGFIFLRFFCPAILSPKLFGLAEQHPDPTTARTLTLIAKILQNLANLTEFASKEPHMSESNNFIKNHINEMKCFIDAISISPGKQEENSDVDFDLRTQCEKFYRFCRSNSRSCFNSKDPDDKKLLDIIQNISNIHIKYREDLLNYQISSDDKSIRKILNNSETSLYDLINEEESNGEAKMCSNNGSIKKELSNFIIDEYTKNEIDDSLKSIIYTIRRFSAQYNKKDNTKRQYNTITKMTGLNQHLPYMEDIFNTSNRSSINNGNISNDIYKLEENDSKS
ncbi:hypothetical protein BCR36DRAFT_188243, partial [Piromyces finnis]